MFAWLQGLGMLRRAKEPDLELLLELFHTAAPRFRCPQCQGVGLEVEPAGDDFGDDFDDSWEAGRLCADCRRPIPAERLQALPHITRCAACQQSQDSGTAMDEPAYCPHCGSPMVVKSGRGTGITRYTLVCSQCRR